MHKKGLSRIAASVSLILVLALTLGIACAGPAPTVTVTAPAPPPVTITAPTTGTATPTPVTPGKYTLRFNVPYPLNLAILPVAAFRPGGDFERLLTRYSNGQIKLDVKEMLYSEDTFYATGDGRIEMGTSMVPDFSGTLPLADFTSLPGLTAPFPTELYEFEDALNDAGMQQILEKAYRTQGNVPLGFYMSGPQILWSAKKKVATLADWKGLKVRSSGQIQASTVKAIGASPVIVTEVELSELLARGTVDAILTDMPYGSAIGLLDLIQYACLWEVPSTMQGVILINAKAYDALPKDMQQALKNAARDMGSYSNYAEELGTGYLMNWFQSKVEVVYPTKEEVAKIGPLLKPVYEEWLGTLKGDAAAGKQILNIMAKYGTGPGIKVAQELAK